jgi:pimeloyl-ACP methyl ester carboxylesterase
MTESNNPPSVVLVHGSFVDGSGWQPVYRLLRNDGHAVGVVQQPTLSLDDDVAAARLIIDAQNGPVVLVGHSYGGAVITEAGNDLNVAALVYVAAFAPDAGESVNSLIADPPPDAPVPPILPPRDGLLFLDRDKFHASFAGDVPADVAEFMANSQVPWGVDALGGTITDPAWRSTELVPRNHRGPDGPAASAADDGRAGGRDDGRGSSEPLGFPVAPGGGRWPDTDSACGDRGDPRRHLTPLAPSRRLGCTRGGILKPGASNLKHEWFIDRSEALK